MINRSTATVAPPLIGRSWLSLTLPPTLSSYGSMVAQIRLHEEDDHVIRMQRNVEPILKIYSLGYRKPSKSQ